MANADEDDNDDDLSAEQFAIQSGFKPSISIELATSSHNILPQSSVNEIPTDEDIKSVSASERRLGKIFSAMLADTSNPLGSLCKVFVERMKVCVRALTCVRRKDFLHAWVYDAQAGTAYASSLVSPGSLPPTPTALAGGLISLSGVWVEAQRRTRRELEQSLTPAEMCTRVQMEMLREPEWRTLISQTIQAIIQEINAFQTKIVCFSIRS
jgi:hypothetical protein